MSRPKQKSARSVAIEVLRRFEPKRDYAAQILDSLLDRTTERQRATDLVFGTIRNRTAIDAVITVFSSRPTQRIPADLLNIIRVAAYELIYRPQTPDYSIVNEAVENAKALTSPKQAGFVNAVLRNITRQIASRQIPLDGADGKATLGQTPSTGCEFKTAFMPDPKADPSGYLSAAFSLPKWLIIDWIAEFGVEQTRQICFASNRRPGIYIRPNTLRTTTRELADKLQQADIDAEIVPPEVAQASSISEPMAGPPGGASSMIRLKSSSAVTGLAGFADGLFSVQDLTASHAARMLAPQPDSRILDLCAAPGTKTTQLAEITGGSAQIVATDINAERLRMVEQNIARLGIGNVEIVPYDALETRAAEIGRFDAVLLDVPCSNTGVLARRIEVRYRLNPAVIDELAKTQEGLLRRAVSMVKPRGRICYSTCSIQSAENSGLVKSFLRQNDNLELESESLILPSTQITARDSAGTDRLSTFDRDGGYVAVLVQR